MQSIIREAGVGCLITSQYKIIEITFINAVTQFCQELSLLLTLQFQLLSLSTTGPLLAELHCVLEFHFSFFFSTVTSKV